MEVRLAGSFNGMEDGITLFLRYTAVMNQQLEPTLSEEKDSLNDDNGFEIESTNDNPRLTPSPEPLQGARN